MHFEKQGFLDSKPGPGFPAFVDVLVAREEQLYGKLIEDGLISLVVGAEMVVIVAWFEQKPEVFGEDM